MTAPIHTGRLSTLAAAFVVARRDFVAILWSRSFLFFLLGPLFPVFVGGLAGSVGAHVEQAAAAPQMGIIMQAKDAQAMMSAAHQLAPHMDGALPDLVLVHTLAPDEQAQPAAALQANTKGQNLAAIVSGTLAAPVLTGTQGRISEWQGPVALVAAQALGHGPQSFPDVVLQPTATSTAREAQSHLLTAQGGQMLLFLLTMLLAGMVLSNLVEEKGNKIIEVLAAAIPMDAVFLGKLFAMLAVSLVGISVWGATYGVILLAAGKTMTSLPPPSVGWPLFVGLGVVYFAMAYLLLGSVFLAVGSIASTVREVQTLSMPATMSQLMVFFLASYAMVRPGSAIETIAMAVPFSSPYAMLARAALHRELWPHAVALIWQVIWVAIFVRTGAHIFRRRVMQSGPQNARTPRKRPVTQNRQ